jgi:hypothetical protein
MNNQELKEGIQKEGDLAFVSFYDAPCSSRIYIVRQVYSGNRILETENKADVIALLEILNSGREQSALGKAV